MPVIPARRARQGFLRSSIITSIGLASLIGVAAGRSNIVVRCFLKATKATGAVLARRQIAAASNGANPVQTYREFAVDEEEPDLMLAAVGNLRKGLAAEGFSPR